MFCGGQCGGVGEALVPFIGMTAAIIIIKIENKIRKWFKKK